MPAAWGRVMRTGVNVSYGLGRGDGEAAIVFLPAGGLALRARRALRGVLLGVAAGLVAAAAAHLPLLDTWERKTLDARIRAFAHPGRADAGIVAVVVDQTSLDVIAARREDGGLEQGWPWPRDYHAIVLRYLIDSGVRAVGVDLIFSETSIYTQLGVAEDDLELARATAEGPVVHAVTLTRESARTGVIHADRDWPEALRSGRFTRPVGAAGRETFNKATLPVGPLLQTARGLGWIGFEPDDDGTYRGLRPAAIYAPLDSPEAVELWSMPVALAAVLGQTIDVAPGRPAGQGFAVGGRSMPLDEDGRMLLRFHGGEGTYRQFSFATVLDAARRHALGHPTPLVPPAVFRDKVVVVGATAAGLLDLRATSIGGLLPAYLIHATALDNLLHGDALRRPPWRFRIATLLALAGLGGLLVAMTQSLRAGAVAALGPGLLYTAAVLAAFDAQGIWLDLVAPALAVGLAYVGASGYGHLTEGRERRFLRSAFSRYLAPEVVEALVSQPGRLALGGETRELTVMFADVAGFTALGERLDPPRLVELMNECFTEVTGAIQSQGGTVDKFIGDAVMAFWNAPVTQPDHAARACRAARDLLEAVARLSNRWSARGLPPISMRVGLATGPGLVGNVGSQTKFNYTVMGDTVNLASRLEGAAKVYDVLSLVAGDTVAAAAGAVEARELDRLQVTGRSEAVPVFEILPARPGTDLTEACEHYTQGLGAYRLRAFGEAAKRFEAALAANPDDGPAREMRDRCLAFLASPPPNEWRGEHVLTEK